MESIGKRLLQVHFGAGPEDKWPNASFLLGFFEKYIPDVPGRDVPHTVSQVLLDFDAEQASRARETVNRLHDLGSGYRSVLRHARDFADQALDPYVRKMTKEASENSDFLNTALMELEVTLKAFLAPFQMRDLELNSSEDDQGTEIYQLLALDGIEPNIKSVFVAAVQVALGIYESNPSFDVKQWLVNFTQPSIKKLLGPPRAKSRWIDLLDEVAINTPPRRAQRPVPQAEPSEDWSYEAMKRRMRLDEKQSKEIEDSQELAEYLDETSTAIDQQMEEDSSGSELPSIFDRKSQSPQRTFMQNPPEPIPQSPQRTFMQNPPEQIPEPIPQSPQRTFMQNPPEPTPEPIPQSPQRTFMRKSPEPTPEPIPQRTFMTLPPQLPMQKPAPRRPKAKPRQKVNYVPRDFSKPVPAQPVKRRGRPRKTKNGTTQEPNMEDGEEEEEYVKPHRGNGKGRSINRQFVPPKKKPRKPKPVKDLSGAGPAQPVRRRGRPRKNKMTQKQIMEEAQKILDQSKVDEYDSPVRAGRGRKVISESEDEGEVSPENDPEYDSPVRAGRGRKVISESEDEGGVSPEIGPEFEESFYAVSPELLTGNERAVTDGSEGEAPGSPVTDGSVRSLKSLRNIEGKRRKGKKPKITDGSARQKKGLRNIERVNYTEADTQDFMDEYEDEVFKAPQSVPERRNPRRKASENPKYVFEDEPIVINSSSDSSSSGSDQTSSESESETSGSDTEFGPERKNPGRSSRYQGTYYVPDSQDPLAIRVV